MAKYVYIPQINCWLNFQFRRPSVIGGQATVCSALVSWLPPTQEKITIKFYTTIFRLLNRNCLIDWLDTIHHKCMFILS